MSEPMDRVNGFTTKEMLVRLETIVDRIEQKLDAKADKRDFDAFEIRQVALEASINLRLVALERGADGVVAVATYRRWLIITGISAVTALSGLLYLLVTVHKPF